MKFLDELLVVFMMVFVFLDVVVNKQYKKYKLLWIITGIMIFYAGYSLVCVSYNTPKAVLYDFIAQMKPFCYFCVSYAVIPKFGVKTKSVLKYICVLNSILVILCFVTGITKAVFFHVTYLGLVSILSAIVFLLCSVNEGGKVSKKDLIVVVVMLTIGLVSTRAKYYGEYVLALYMLFMYKPGLMKKINIKQVLLFIAILGVVLFVSWQKIDYYFISGGQDYQMFDEEMMESFARPVMYASMFVVLSSHLLFGSGLASFGTNASSTTVNYSQLYSEIGIDSVWGLSEDFDLFICDAFYPVLAQFGLVGIILFVYLFVWIYRNISLLLYCKGKVHFLIGILTIVVLLIESVAATTFNQGAGAMCMMILGYLCATFKNVSQDERITLKQKGYRDKGALVYIK